MEHEDHEGREDPKGYGGLPESVEAAGRQVVDAALKVHRSLGPGLLESAYELCLAHELARRGIPVRRQVALPVEFEGLRLDAGYRLDMVVDDMVVVEVKAVEALSRLHGAQILTYLRLSGMKLGLLVNFNAVQLRQGLRRFVR
ncbi:GxxExxY protein [Phenylobacterium sp.]|uniref:GxxExxY protein n=1 Tax=Phenylobacterium sp. TaxID=1871053 RepID=UPI0025D717EE|nr:GxxExxY protein [Phenylobacterium sp.]